MGAYRKPKKVEIVYFSGTGSTKKVAGQFADSFMKENVEISNYEINSRNRYVPQKSDMLLLIYPVYACNAPKPIYEFIKTLPIHKGKKTVVISVSGGGEVTPNKACRLHTIKQLELKGYRVVYEKMIVMPSNVFVATPEAISVRLLEVLPVKVEHIIHDLLSGVRRRVKPDLLNRIIACAGELEKTRLGGELFGRNIKVNQNCSGCGICQKGCPMENITLRENVPVFGRKCAICLKCIYSCPRKALKPLIGNFFILKQGYPLKIWENKMNQSKEASDSELTKGYAMSGIHKYLTES